MLVKVYNIYMHHEPNIVNVLVRILTYICNT
jgi:hypothetical protein